MPKYIDADALDGELLAEGFASIVYSPHRRYKLTVGEVRGILQKYPAADVVPVVHGHWNIIQDTLAVDGAGKPLKHIECSQCKQYWSDPRQAKYFKHCFNCGALMDGKDDNR